MPHLSLEEALNFFPVQRVKVKVYELLRYLGLDVALELDPQLIHGQLLRQTGLQLLCVL